MRSLTAQRSLRRISLSDWIFGTPMSALRQPSGIRTHTLVPVPNPLGRMPESAYPKLLSAPPSGARPSKSSWHLLKSGSRPQNKRYQYSMFSLCDGVRRSPALCVAAVSMDRKHGESCCSRELPLQISPDDKFGFCFAFLPCRKRNVRNPRKSHARRNACFH